MRAAIVPKLIREEHYRLIGTFAEHDVADSSEHTPPFDSGLDTLMALAEGLKFELDLFVLEYFDEGAAVGDRM